MSADRVLAALAVTFILVAIVCLFSAIWIHDPDLMHRVVGTGALSGGVGAICGLAVRW